MEKMILTKALDERDFLKKKIIKDINAFRPIMVKREMDPKLSNGQTEEEFIANVQAQYQSIKDNIDRHHRICKAIILSNATTMITVGGVEMTKAEAIELKKKMSTSIKDNQSFEAMLIGELGRCYNAAMDNYIQLQSAKDQKKDNYTNSMLAGSTDKSKKLSVEDSDAIDRMVAGYTPKIVDPIDVKKEFQDMDSKLSRTLEEIDTAIKISNATTEIEF